MKTAMQELIEMLPPYFFDDEEIKMFLEKEKEQIKEAFYDGRLYAEDSVSLFITDHEENYYNETFKN